MTAGAPRSSTTTRPARATVALLLAARAADPPRVARENIERLDVPGTAAKDPPRVLLIGDSLTRGYDKTVEDTLMEEGGRAPSGDEQEPG